ncbi:structure-specific endonuclease subunit SLX4 isoform X1 [Anopheles funestus]|uniref:structure-specific endonuclease subunit SLX4 isoform X1 n=1 Tax=Anopheles funestus TaxID=62324 RepID=UPI0020C6F857|nr:structure-specific endonuclease subunit SLX4 isoform X1 [Anopheles funestus]
MSKRLKYAKLRLAKPINVDDTPSTVVPVHTNVGSLYFLLLHFSTDSTVITQTSKYFNNRVEKTCTNEETFILIHSEDSGEDNGKPKEQSSRRRTQKPPKLCPNDGPKLPKLRKKTCDGNRLISNFLSSQTNRIPAEDNDFEEDKPGPGAQSKQTKVQRVTKKTTKAPKQIKNQSDIRKVFKKYKSDHELLNELLKEHSTSEHIDPEQLQIALAMSRSLIDQDCDQKPTTSGESRDRDFSVASCSGSSEERRIVSIRTTLEQFGFRCKNSYTDYDLNVIFGSASSKNVKKIKHKRATNLQFRSKEELAAFIDNQVKKLIPLRTLENATSAGKLQDSRSIKSHLSNHFWIAQTELSSNQLMEKYYVPELLRANPAPVGCMLKDWSKIPGRDSTPDRYNDVPREKITASMDSPDLFNESEIIKRASKCGKIDKSLVNNIEAEKTKQECGMENEQKHYSQEMLVIRSSNESASVNLNVDSRVLKKSSNTIDSNNVEQRVEMFETTLHDMNQSLVSNKCNERQEELFALNDNSEEDKRNFVTECVLPAFYQSSENIFDDTDPDPIVSFEVFSSEEEKISAISQVRVVKKSASGDTGIAETAQQDRRKDIILEQNDANGLPNEEETDIESKTLENCHDPHVMEAWVSSKKDLSFHRLSIKARLREALEGNPDTIATVDLIENDPDFDKTISNLAHRNVNIQIGAQYTHLNNTQDDVLYISDDEVNHSICCVPAASYIESVKEKLGNTSKADLDVTITYNVAESIAQRGDNVNILPSKLECQPTEHEEPIMLACYSNDNGNEPVVGEINCAESTLAYLDHLVKEFNLPPLKSQQNAQNDNGNHQMSLETEICQETLCIKKHASKMYEQLSNRLHSYEEHKFENHDIDYEITASQSLLKDNVFSGGIGTTPARGLSKMKTCTTFDSPKNRSVLKRPVPETGYLSSSTPHEKDAPKLSGDNRFENKFNELKTAEVDIPETEYVIRTLNVNQKPPAYEDMSTSEIERELFKYGLKALQRSKAVRMLYYLFEMMHPYVMIVERYNIPMGNKDPHRKVKDVKEKHKQILTSYSSVVLKTPRKCAFKLDLNSTQFFLPSKPRKKMAWCGVPLHISFFNLVSECDQLQRQILRYEPVSLHQVDELLKDGGLRYETNDLRAFFDKHSITFRTASSNGERMAKE